jgi:hypothetical protein
MQGLIGTEIISKSRLVRKILVPIDPASQSVETTVAARTVSASRGSLVERKLLTKKVG